MGKQTVFLCDFSLLQGVEQVLFYVIYFCSSGWRSHFSSYYQLVPWGGTIGFPYDFCLSYPLGQAVFFMISDTFPYDV